MSDPNLALIYFSGTHVTQTYSYVIHDALSELGCTAQLFDVTSYKLCQEPPRLDDFQAMIFGFPVYADFAPSVINAWLPPPEGKGKPCAQFFTYGARTSGYAHFHTLQLLKQAGFHVLLSAEFLGRHSFNVGGWEILPERPDQLDFSVTREFANLTLERFSIHPYPILKLQKPFGYNQAISELQEQPKRRERGWTNPVRITPDCSMCRDCEFGCPNQAFDADSGLSNPADCIEYIYCLHICPDQVIEIDKRMEAAYADFKTIWHLTEPMMRAKKSKIISESWQAAA